MLVFCSSTQDLQSPVPVHSRHVPADFNGAVYRGSRAEVCLRMLTGVRMAKVYRLVVSAVNIAAVESASSTKKSPTSIPTEPPPPPPPPRAPPLATFAVMCSSMLNRSSSCSAFLRR